jgi:hypothetical protein
MALASYRIVHREDGWAVKHDRDLAPPFATRAFAFEAALGPASNAIEAGDVVRIEVDATREDEPALGWTRRISCASMELFRGVQV